MTYPVDNAEFDLPQLILAAQSGDADAKDKLVSQNLPLVKSIAKRYVRWNASMDDLCQVGAIGLIKAIDKFDQSYNVKFSTYAVNLIAGEIKRFLRDDGTIKVSRSIKALAAAAAAASDALRLNLGRSARIGEIADYLKVSEYDISQALDAMLPCKSLSEGTLSDSRLCCGDMVGDDLKCEELMMNRAQIRRCISALGDRERRVILLRYFRCMTQGETALILGLSQTQISRMERSAIAHMKAMF